MGMMARMRNLAPWFIISVGGIFVLFMVFSDSNITRIFNRPTNDVGSINGVKVSYKEYSQLVETARKNEVARTGKELDDTQMEFLRDQVWDAIVIQKLVEQKIKEYGIKVTDDEIKDALLGPNPPKLIARYFTDSTGHFNRQKYEEAIFNPRNKEAMIQTENMIRRQKLQEKLQAYVSASVVVGENEIKRKFIGDNIKMYADYVLVRANTIPDSLISFNDNDLRKYYEEHLEAYKIPPQRQLDFVLFRNLPSKDDTISVRTTLENLVTRFENDTSSFKSLVKVYSDQPYKIDTLTINQIPRQAVSSIMKAKKGAVVGPVLTYQGYVLFHLLGKIKTGREFVRASHILIKNDKNDAQAKKQINEIYKKLKAGADFSKLAKEYSQDVGSARRGGDLGWFGKGQMVKPFEKAAFKGRIGKIQKPIKTRFGYHIIKVTGRTNKAFVVERIINKIQTSATTMDELYNKASDFSYLARKNDFFSEAKLMHYKIKKTPKFPVKTENIPGLGTNRGLVHFATSAELGDVSDVFKTPLGYIVARMSLVTEGGYKKFEKVKNSIVYYVKNIKKREKALDIAGKIRKKIGSSGNLQLAYQVYPLAVVSKARNFTRNKTIVGLGFLPKFKDYCLKADLNKLSQPIKEEIGAFLVRVTDRTKFDSSSYKIQHNIIRNQLLRARKARVYEEWLKKLKEKADIVDVRYKFYR